MDEVKDLIQQVRVSAENELEFCNQGETPIVCQLISTPKGKAMVIDLILEYVGKRNMTISEAIIAIERENDPKLSEVN